jgi:hypothetical protein
VHQRETWPRRLAAWLEAWERQPLRAAILASLLALQIGPWWHATPDAAAYVSIARSITTGDRVAALGNEQLGFPIGYPALISPAFLTGDRPFLLLSIVNAACWLAFVAGVHRWGRRLVPDAAWLLTALTVANVNTGILYRRTLSEVLFLPLMIWTVNLLNDAAATVERRRSHRRWLAGILLLLAAVLTREAGVCLAVGLGLALLHAHNRQPARLRLAAAFFLPLALLAAAPLLIRPERLLAAWRAVNASFDTTPPVAAGWLAPLIEGTRTRIMEAGQLLVPGMFKAHAGRGDWLNVNMPVYLPVCALVAWGWIRLLRRRPDVLVYTAPFYVAIHLIWPYGGAGRYLLPLLPLLLASLWTALEVTGERRRAIFAVLLLGHLAVTAGYAVGVDLPRARACHRQWPAVSALANRVSVDSGVAVAADVPACVWLMLQLELDRRMLTKEVTEGAGDEVRWIVVNPGAAHVGGFAADGNYGEYVLLHRESSGKRR